MPRGVYDRSAAKAQREDVGSFPVVHNARQIETEEQIDRRIAERFEVLESLTTSVIGGVSRSLIVSGPAGLGKSYTVESVMRNWDPAEVNHAFVRGYVRPTGLYKLLHRYKNPGKVIIFDDADTVFLDEVSLSLLKAVADTTERRRVSWLSEGTLMDEETADIIPNGFDFNGSIIFITNIDFDAALAKGSRLGPHLNAMMSRSHYLDLAMKTKQDYLVRIRQVVKQGLLSHLNWHEQSETMRFIEKNFMNLREISLRMVIKVANIRRDTADWEKVARITCLRNN